MWGWGRKNDETLRAAVDAVRDDVPPAEVEAVASERVAAQIEARAADAGERIEGCRDVERLLPLYQGGGLTPARAMLVEDHLRECVRCRGLAEQGGTRRAAGDAWTDSPVPVRPATGHRWLALAASVGIVAVGLSTWAWLFRSPRGPRMSVQSTSGILYAVDGSSLRPLAPGAQLSDREAVRTARGGHAVLALYDGSHVEVDERAQLAVSARGQDTTILLDRGNIIVRAAKRHTGHLYVTTADCRVAVTGTVFSVRHGLAGSRVSVIQGEVRVAHAGEEEVLQPGDQVSTSAALEPVPVAEDIDWSRDKDQYVALLSELSALKKSLATVEEPAVRYESRLMGLVPPDTRVFVGMPNYGKTIDEAYGLFKDRLAESPALQQWWEQQGLAAHAERIDDAVASLRACSEYLGDEVIVAVGPAARDQRPEVLLLAEERQAGLHELVTSKLTELGADGKLSVRFVDDAELTSVQQSADTLFVLETKGLVAASPSVATLQALQARLASGQSAFASTPLGQRVAQAYSEGTGALVAVDVAALGGKKNEMAPQFVIAERKQIDGQIHNSAEVEFAQAHPGLAAWLAPSGTMGSLDFVSPGAAGAVALLLKNPDTLIEETLDQQRQAKLQASLDEIEQKVGVRLREDVIASLGGEVALALDGPVLPTPSWKLVLEVVDPDALNQALETVVARLQEQGGKPEIRLDREQVQGRVLQTLHVKGDVSFEVHFAVIDGYLVATPSRALLARAIATHESGDSLGRSSRLARLMPAGTDAHCSGIIYQNLGIALGPIAQTLRDSGQLPADAQKSLDALAQSAEPSLIALYGEQTRLRLAAVGSMPGIDMAGLAVPALLRRAMSGTSALGRP
jgi:hypothetical protein